jgi:DUF4097 and DUF4098 domain-containing protein YvlB
MRNVIALFAMCLLVVAPAAAQTKVDEAHPLAADGVVEISNIAGSVTVIGTGAGEVEITGVLGANVSKLQVSGTERHLEIEVKPKEGTHRGHDAELTIRMPSGATLDLETVSAKVAVDGLSGEVEIETVSGAVTIEGRPSVLEVESVSGDTVVAFAPPETEIESVSGRIEVRDGRGTLEAANVSGAIEVLGGAFDEASLESVSGSIIWRADFSGRGSFEMETMSGDLEVVVDPGASADFDVSTFSGRITSDFGPEAERTSKHAPGKELHFAMGSGGGRVSLSSFSGSVEIKAR